MVGVNETRNKNGIVNGWVDVDKKPNKRDKKKNNNKWRKRKKRNMGRDYRKNINNLNVKEKYGYEVHLLDGAVEKGYVVETDEGKWEVCKDIKRKGEVNVIE